jgi:hypothetical protein
VFLSIAIYLAACLLPALMLHTGGYIYTKDLQKNWRWGGNESLRGAELLFIGWFGLLIGNFAVLANPALWLSWLLLGTRRDRGAVWCSAIALLLAMLTFQLIFQPYRFDEAGAKLGYLAFPHIGFYAWIASMALIAFAALKAPRDTANPA